MAEDLAQKKLRPEEIRFLALEGGGGKGFAYLGALQVLEKKHVMAHVDRVSGTSAGAITALMLALGLTAQEIDSELSKNDFTTFFDPPLDRQGQRLLPRAGKYIPQTIDQCETQMLKGWTPEGDVAAGAQAAASVISRIGISLLTVPAAVVSGTAAALRNIRAALSCLLNQNSTLARLFWAYGWLLSGQGDTNRKIAAMLGMYGGLAAPDANAAISALVKGLPQYLVFLPRDMGLFSGQAARDYFENLINRRLTAKLGADRAARLKNLTFGQFRELKGPSTGFRDLLVCGANLSIGRSVLFSWRHTANFPIADAVRISMSLPLVYKPYVVVSDVKGYPPCGTYVDGGIWNNLPFREIGALEASAPRQTAQRPTSRPVRAAVGQRSTLGLRLEIDPPKTVRSADELLATWIGTGLAAGETQILPDLDPFIQILDTTGLSTLQFSPPAGVRNTVTSRSRRTMYRYFGAQVPPEDRDDEDDRRIAELRARTACG